MKLALLLLLALPVLAEDTEPLVAPMKCAESLCLVDKKFMLAMIEAHNQQKDEIDQLKAEKREPPKCAELRVEKSKKERAS